MKTPPRSLLIVLCALLALALTGTASAQSARVAVTAKLVDISPKTKKAKDDKDGKPADETEVSKLAISVRNSAREPLSGVEVKYWFVVRNSGDGAPETNLANEAAKTVELEAGGVAEFESEPLTTIFKPAYTPKKGKRVRASGDKVMGWGVKALVGGQVAGEVYSSDSAKQAINAPDDKN